MAQMYRGQSVAEQHSLTIAWNMLMQDSYKDLRRAISCNQQELQQFRSILVTAVLATDLADKPLNAARTARWNTAFQHQVDDGSDGTSSILMKNGNTSRVATTLVIEYIMQASDVAHTMQHFQVYTKWNKRLFQEMYLAYRQGRTDRNPVEFWYQEELQFFDGYIIPLAQKLKDCGLFGGGGGGGNGSSSGGEEYLRYAMANRAEWEEIGQELVAQFCATDSSSSLKVDG